MTDNVLEIRELSKDYGDFVLDRVSFALPRGVIMGLIGENGAGKSTTINCILNETQKSDGQVLIFGKDHIADEIEIKDKLGVVFDENHFPDIFTPEEIGKFMCGIYSGWDWQLYHQHLEKFELPKNKKIKDFSKGMKVKLAFAVALSPKAELQAVSTGRKTSGKRTLEAVQDAGGGRVLRGVAGRGSSYI